MLIFLSDFLFITEYPRVMNTMDLMFPYYVGSSASFRIGKLYSLTKTQGGTYFNQLKSTSYIYALQCEVPTVVPRPVFHKLKRYSNVSSPMVLKGTVKWFNESKSFGFIEQESGPMFLLTTAPS